jgi:hypothetical protein
VHVHVHMSALNYTFIIISAKLTQDCLNYQNQPIFKYVTILCIFLDTREKNKLMWTVICVAYTFCSIFTILKNISHKSCIPWWILYLMLYKSFVITCFWEKWRNQFWALCKVGFTSDRYKPKFNLFDSY